jgi:hypothetical protein
LRRLCNFQLAPIERVWKLTRRLAAHNRYFATLPEVRKAVSACFDRWHRPNKVLHLMQRRSSPRLPQAIFHNAAVRRATAKYS